MKYFLLLVIPLYIITILAAFLIDWNLTHLGLILLAWIIIDGYGVELGIHRMMSHDVYNPGPIQRKVLSILGCFGGQWSPLWWASLHKVHHATADTEKDPHSPVVHGWWYSFIQWYLKANLKAIPLNKKIAADPFQRFLHKNYILIFWIPIIWSALAFGPAIAVCLFVIPAMLSILRVNTVNTMCHIEGFGKQSYFLGRDKSRDLPILGLFTWGLALHNTHHARQELLYHDGKVGFDPMHVMLLGKKCKVEQ